jgi:hypothetical protein
MPTARKRNAINVAREIALSRGGPDGFRLLERLVEVVPKSHRRRAVRDALESALQIAEVRERALALASFATCLNDSDVNFTCAKAVDFADAESQGIALVPLILRLAEVGSVAKTCEMARALNSPRYKVKAMTSLFSYKVHESFQKEGLTILADLIRRFCDEFVSNDFWGPSSSGFSEGEISATLSGLISGLHPGLYPQLQQIVGQWLRCIVVYGVDKQRGTLCKELGRLAPVLTHLGGTRALAEAAHGILDVSLWWP